MLVGLVAGGDLGEGPARAGDRVRHLVGRGHAHDVLLSLAGFGRGDLAEVGRRRVGAVARVDVGHGRVAVVGDVVLGDLAGALVVGDGGAVGGEPFLGGDDGFGLGVVGVAFGEQGLGVLGGGAGAGGVGEPDGAGVVELLELGGALVEGLGQGRGLGGLLVQPGALGGVGGGVGFGAAQGRGLAVVGGGLAGAGELVADVAGSPGLFALPARGRACGAGRRTVSWVAWSTSGRPSARQAAR